MTGTATLADALAAAGAALGPLAGERRDQPRASGPQSNLGTLALWPKPRAKGRVWIDYQNDVTAKDVELAARENFVSVEHLKRYTTLGMATDQGKTSNLNGLALLAGITGRSIPEVGTTAYRPPFTPVPFPSFVGSRRGSLLAPVRRLPLENVHRQAGAVFQEYGGWLRPAHYGGAGCMIETGVALDAVPIGLEALMILRAENGYIVIGKDTARRHGGDR